MNDDIIRNMFNSAKKMAEENFCCKHSNFSVGVSILTKSGKIYSGFNIENDGIMSICAERVALAKALTEGEKEFSSLLVYGMNLKTNEVVKTLPCGYCRQFLMEYTGPDLLIYALDENKQLNKYTLKELLPESFELKEN